MRLQLRNGDHVSLRIDDNGAGFDPDAPRSSQSFGLTGMRERTESLGGEFELVSRPGVRHRRAGDPAVIGVAVACCLSSRSRSTSSTPRSRFMEYDDLREGQLEAAAAMVMTVAGGVLLGRFRRRARAVPARRGRLARARRREHLRRDRHPPVVDSLAADHPATWTAAGSAAVGATLLAVATGLCRTRRWCIARER